MPKHEFGVIGFNLFVYLPFKIVHVKGTGERHIPEIHYLPKPQCSLGSKGSSQQKHILQEFDDDCFLCTIPRSSGR